MLFETLTIKEVKIRVGRLARTLRKSGNLSQEELATVLNISRITIRNLEAGRNITLDTLLKVFLHFDALDSFVRFVESEMEDHHLKSFY
jgi:transcriptional regulator with XRE-family HTH domain